ncbi:helix-turn-helix domain-containing protein [Mycolicibacterium goodii]|uniref:Helix-turn-helix domain-containing protein n=1 Tax=Mycolicibacterium goodii TaxID=134601 RepID=A0ABS6HZN5_MYCGD|nr:helix-turn-helix transcriptional regulator [Mycolicibacterium goodii]MBU8826957.1 helix-turn-helix domain-containing protein [Mycolicibacterium goodii]MBU8841410.1 helix-turn-helix domain-containing protein [Mycolicibacterium goodii]OKH71838.1 XRE family transcriptional regulator [Mycobacterium sp. SWH-M5]
MPTQPSRHDPRRIESWERRRQAVGGAIRRLRKERGLTQEQLADRSGVDRTVLIDVELGRQGLLYERLFDIAEALELPVVDLFGDA